jgi:hypothetical protein
MLESEILRAKSVICKCPFCETLWMGMKWRHGWLTAEALREVFAKKPTLKMKCPTCTKVTHGDA